MPTFWFCSLGCYVSCTDCFLSCSLGESLLGESPIICFQFKHCLLLGFFFLKKHVTNHPFPHYLLGHLQWSKHFLKSWYLFTCSMKERPCLFHSQYSPIVLNGAWHVEGVWQIFVEWIHELDKLGLGLDHLGGSPSSNEALWFSKSITKSIHLSSWDLLPVYWPR